MHRATLATAFAAIMACSAPSSADVQVGIHIDVPPPPVVTFAAPPRLVVVPGVPHVHYAPDVSVNFFSYGGRYYTYDDGNWFVARGTDGPWGYVEQRYVPAPVLRVPSRYYVSGGHWDRHYYRDDDRHDGKHWKKNKKHWKKHGNGKHGHKHH